jgi:hypothetical protein
MLNITFCAPGLATNSNTYIQINLDAVANRNVFQDPWNDGGGDFSIGESYGYPYPLGDQVMDGIPFHLTENAIILNGGALLANGTPRYWQDAWDFPSSFSIPIGDKIDKAYFIHTSGWTWVPYGTTIATYEIQYTDGISEIIELKNGINIDEISVSTSVAVENKHAFFCLRNPTYGAYEFEIFAYNLNRPNKEVASIDFVDAGNSPAPILVALTVERSGFTHTIDIDPNTLNLKSKGKWITCYIELSGGFDVRDIEASTILLEDSLSPILDTKYGFVKSEDSYIMDHDDNGILERMVKFDRSDVEDMLSPGTYNLKVTGELMDGTPFEGNSDEIKVIDPAY